MGQIHQFTKELKATDINFAFSVPVAFLQAVSMPGKAHVMSFEAVDSTDTPWKFCLSTRMTGFYRKPVLRHSSWHPFVVSKGLIPNDRVILFVEQDGVNNNKVMRFWIRAQRKIMTLMVQDVWVDVENLHIYGL